MGDHTVTVWVLVVVVLWKGRRCFSTLSPLVTVKVVLVLKVILIWCSFRKPSLVQEVVIWDSVNGGGGHGTSSVFNGNGPNNDQFSVYGGGGCSAESNSSEPVELVDMVL